MEKKVFVIMLIVEAIAGLIWALWEPLYKTYVFLNHYKN